MRKIILREISNHLSINKFQKKKKALKISKNYNVRLINSLSKWYLMADDERSIKINN